jgi:hypothetical protein
VGQANTSTAPRKPLGEAEWRRRTAARTFNEVWILLEKADRAADESEIVGQALTVVATS